MDNHQRFHFQLRRIGKPATVLGVKDIMRVNKDVTRFGRHSENDYFLDSSEFLCLVSRWHSELHRVEQQGHVQYMLRDNSLNGTYVNNMRVKGNQELRLGDTVMFGHPNGKNIQPGQSISPSYSSEFSFKFEKIPLPVPAPAPSSERIDFPQIVPEDTTCSKLTSNVDPLLAVPGSPVIPVQKKGPVRSLSSQETPTVGEVRVSNVNRRLLSESDKGSSDTTLVLKDISNTRLRSAPGLVHLDQLFKSHGTVSPGRIKAPKPEGKSTNPVSDSEEDAKVFAAATKSASNFAAAPDSDEDIFDSFKPLDPQDTTKALPTSIFQQPPPPPVTVPVFSPAPLPLPTSHTINDHELTYNHADDLTDTKLNVLNQVANLSNRHFAESLSSSSSSDEDNEVESFMAAATTTAAITTAAATTTPSSSSQYYKDPFIASPAPSRRGMKRQRSETPSGRRSDTPSNRRSCKKRRKGKRWTAVKKRANSPEEDFHYDGDPCDSVECFRPAGNKVSWVQCDDCDKWYHTVCAGTSFDAVNDTQAQFHCGCA